MDLKARVPKVLACLHSFCLECILRIQDGEGQEIQCPACRTFTKAEPRTLHNNFSLVRMLEILSIEEADSFDCDECEESEASAVERCRECQKFLCRPCAIHHRRAKSSKGHNMVTVDEFKATAKDLGLSSSRSDLFCTIHEGESLRLFCETCEMLICRDCTMIDHTRPEHK